MNGAEPDSPFSGLPSGLALELLGRSAQIAVEMSAPFREIAAGREGFRRALGERNLLGMFRQAQDERIQPAPGMCGIDWFSDDSMTASRSVFAAAFGVEGLAPTGAACQWDAPRHRLAWAAEPQPAKSPAVLNAVSLELAVELATASPHRYVLANGSCAGLCAGILGNLKSAMDEKETAAGREYLRRFKPAVAALAKLFDPAEDRFIGMPRYSAKRELTAGLDGAAGCDDRVLYTMLLEPGEYAGPVAIDAGEVDAVARLAVRDDAFIAARDVMVNTIREFRVLYFRPQKWTPAMRVELSRATAENRESLHRVLAGLAYQCRTPGLARPYPLVRTEALTLNLSRCLPAIRQMLAANMTGTDGACMDGLLPLLMDGQR